MKDIKNSKSETKKQRKCSNCEEYWDIDDCYKYERKIYCISCLEDYYNEEIAFQYFDNFLEEECQKLGQN